MCRQAHKEMLTDIIKTRHRRRDSRPRPHTDVAPSPIERAVSHRGRSVSCVSIYVVKVKARTLLTISQPSVALTAAAAAVWIQVPSWPMSLTGRWSRGFCATESTELGRSTVGTASSACWWHVTLARCRRHITCRICYDYERAYLTNLDIATFLVEFIKLD